MPHFVVEYTDNIKEEADIRLLLKKANTILIDQGGLFPIGGIRSRAIELKDYVMADDDEDYAFVHASLTVAGGRSKEATKKVCDELFLMMTEHFADIFKKHYFALSMEFNEFSNSTYKKNNVHTRFKKNA